MSSKCNVYYTDEGYISFVTGGWIDPTLQDKYNMLEVDSISIDDSYVDNGTIKTKEDWEPSIEGNSILNIPNPSRVFINGEELSITDGTLDIDKPSTYTVKVRISPVRYLPKEVTL